MKNLFVLSQFVFFFLIISFQNAVQAQIGYGGTTGTIFDTYVINDDKSNHYSALRFQTTDDKAFMLTNKGAALSFSRSTSASNFNDEGTWLMSLNQLGHLHLNTLSFEGFLMRAENGLPIAFNTGARETMRISNEGNVGIGTSSPNYRLHVNGSTRVESFSMGGNNNFRIDAPGVVGGRFTVLDNGNVGIGTATPDHKLEVTGISGVGTPITTNGRIWTGKNSTTGGVWVNSKSGAPTQFFGTFDNVDKMGIFNDGWKLIVDNEGRVGINTQNPTHALDVNGIVKATKMYIGGVSPANVRDALEDATGISYYLWVEKGVVAEDFAIAPKASWDDYVFDENYELPTLEKVAAFVKVNKHLPNIPSKADVNAKGYTVHQLSRGFLKTIEELTLYAIEQNNSIRALEAQVAAQKVQLEQFGKLEQRIKQLEAKH